MPLVEVEGLADRDVDCGRHALDALEHVEPRWAGVDVDRRAVGELGRDAAGHLEAFAGGKGGPFDLEAGCTHGVLAVRADGLGSEVFVLAVFVLAVLGQLVRSIPAEVAVELVDLVRLLVDDAPQDIGELAIVRHAAGLARHVVRVVRAAAF